MSNQDDGFPKLEEIWHMGAHGDGTCARWRCVAIQPATSFNTRQFVFRALRYRTDEIDPSIQPQAVFESDIQRGTTDLHGPEIQDDETDELLAFMSPNSSRVTVQPLMLPKGVSAEAAQAVFTPLLTAMLGKLAAEGLAATQRRLKRLELAGWDVDPLADGRLAYTDAEIKSIEAEAERQAIERVRGNLDTAGIKQKAHRNGYKEGLAEGERLAIERVGGDLAKHPCASAIAALSRGARCVIACDTHPTHGPQFRLIEIKPEEERASRRRFVSTGAMPENTVRELLRDVMIPADAALIDTLHGQFPRDWQAMLKASRDAGYSEGEHAGITAGEKATLDAIRRGEVPVSTALTVKGVLDLEDALRADLVMPRVVVIGRDFESWSILTRMHSSPEIGGTSTYGHEGNMRREIVQGALTECLSSFGGGLEKSLAGWPGGILNDVNRIVGNARPIMAPGTNIPLRDPTPYEIERQERAHDIAKRLDSIDTLMRGSAEIRIALATDSTGSWVVYTAKPMHKSDDVRQFESEGPCLDKYAQRYFAELLAFLAPDIMDPLTLAPKRTVGSHPGIGMPYGRRGAGAMTGTVEDTVRDRRDPTMQATADTMAAIESTPSPAELAAYGGLPKPDLLAVRAAVRLLIRYSHGNSLASGWWPEVKEGLPRVGKMTHSGQRNFGELLCLIHSEISESLEGYRKNKDDEHLPGYKNHTVELADALHRIFDLAGAMRLSLAEAYADKGEYNLVREDHKPENRAKEGGKTF